MGRQWIDSSPHSDFSQLLHMLMHGNCRTCSTATTSVPQTALFQRYQSHGSVTRQVMHCQHADVSMKCMLHRRLQPATADHLHFL